MKGLHMRFLKKKLQHFREARIEVAEILGNTGAYKAVAFLHPHYQLDELTVSLRLVAKLPPPANTYGLTNQIKI
jgi:predicted component of type VI protein secretion system